MAVSRPRARPDPTRKARPGTSTKKTRLGSWARLVPHFWGKIRQIYHAKFSKLDARPEKPDTTRKSPTRYGHKKMHGLARARSRGPWDGPVSLFFLKKHDKTTRHNTTYLVKLGLDTTSDPGDMGPVSKSSAQPARSIVGLTGPVQVRSPTQRARSGPKVDPDGPTTIFTSK